MNFCRPIFLITWHGLSIRFKPTVKTVGYRCVVPMGRGMQNGLRTLLYSKQCCIATVVKVDYAPYYRSDVGCKTKSLISDSI